MADSSTLSPSREIYLDSNATTRVLPCAANAARSAMETLYGNPSSSHITGLRARHILETARQRARAVLGAERGRVVFTSGATEAIQLAVVSALSAAQEAKAKRRRTDGAAGPLLLFGATEHKAVPEALRHWNRLLRFGAEVLAIPVDREGQLDLEFLREHASRADLVATMAVNNETGVITDLSAVERVLRAENPSASWLVDAVQAVGKQPLDLQTTTVDYASVSGHKLYAPKGVGLLYVRDGAPVTPLIAGGGQESGARSGTENLPGVAALGAIFECLLDPNDDTFQPRDVLEAYRDRIASSLRTAFPGIVFNAPAERTVPTTLNFSVHDLASKELLDLFDAAGIRVSSGSACGSAVRGSYVLDAMGLPEWQSEGAIRLSFGPAAASDKIDAACETIEEAGRALRGTCILATDDLDVVPGDRPRGLFQLRRGSNCTYVYVTPGAEACVVIDPIAAVAERIENLVRCQGCGVAAILDTHGHNDRPSCRDPLADLFASAFTRNDPRDALGWPIPDGEVRLGDGTDAPFLALPGGEVLAMIECPGHTADSRAYLLGRLSADGALLPDGIRFAFAGDTVLIGGIGRSDFPASVGSALYDSLRRMDRIVSGRTVICPTHDYGTDFATTLATEKRESSLLDRVVDPISPIGRDDFLVEMERLDRSIEDRDGEIVCGLIRPIDDASSSVDVQPEELSAFFAKHRDSLVVDVREPHEYRLFADWESLGLERAPRNVPLTKFCDFVARVLEPESDLADRDVIFVCRSGNRSGRAASVLRRLGVERCWHIAGGIAQGGRRRAGAESSR